MVATLAHTFESGQSSGTTITTGNSGTGGSAFNATTIGTGATLTYFTSPIRGSLCMRATTSGTSSQCFANWTSTSLTGASRMYARATLRVDATGSQCSVFRMRGAGVQSCRVTVNPANNRIELRDTGNTVRATSTAAMTLGVSVWRIAVDITVGASATGILYIWFSPASTTPDETLTVNSQNWGTANIDECTWGVVAAATNVDLLVDDVMVTSVALPGPAEQSGSTADTATVADTAGQQLAAARAHADTADLADAVTRDGGAASADTAETVTAADTPTGNTSGGRAHGDSLAVADAIASNTSGGRSAGDSLGISDALTRAGQPLARSVANTVTAADAAAAGPLTAARAVAETVTAADTTAGTAAKGRAVADAVTAADAAANTRAQARAEAESVSLSDAVLAGAIGTINVSESITAGDAASGATVAGRTIVDGAAFSDTHTRAGISRTRTIANAATLADAASRQLVAERPADYGVQLVDALTRITGPVRVPALALTATDTATRSPLAAARELDLAVTAVDSLSSGRVQYIGVAEAVALTDLTVRGVGRPIAATVAVAVADAVDGVYAVAPLLAAASRIVDTTASATVRDTSA